MICTRCDIEKSLDQFYTNSKSKWCRDCHRETTRLWRLNNPERAKQAVKSWRERNPDHLRREAVARYGITLEEYDEMWEEQDGLCAICNLPEELREWLSVDHNHLTGKVRRLLCNKCNTGLGKFNDSLELLKAAVAYLEDHR